MDSVTRPPVATNETVRMYAPGSPERASLEKRLVAMAGERLDLPCAIGAERRMGSGEQIDVVQPHARHQVLGTLRGATHDDARAAMDAAKKAAPGWRAMSFDDRAAILLKAADLLAGPWRDTLNAATMLGQSKTCYQAEIDAACELIDFWRFNVGFARQILEEQPISSPGVWNRVDHRPLEGVVYAVTPFNFTAIAGNLPTAPALMGNVVIWKPAHSQQLAAHYLMELLTEAGLPPGVITMVTGHGVETSDVVLSDPDLAGIHFTGSTRVFQQLWRTVGENIASYRSYPRIVGETGGKDFVVAHPSADVDVLRTALVRGAFEYQGQKCSAASRAYVPRSIWKTLRDDLASTVDGLSMGPTTDFSNFMAAVIDDRAYARVTGAIDRAKADANATIIAGGTYDDSEGWFIRLTVVEHSDPTAEFFRDEYFGPLLGVRRLRRRPVRRDARADGVGGAVRAHRLDHRPGPRRRRPRDRVPRFAAGNFINDKPTGAVVGQQPFGGARASGTNDKAGAPQNLLRWTSTRSLKETLVPPKDHTYPHMG
ncbi:MAG: L-glutamate gamma-semialdehyde dehydrogenase [Candidatus Nanopelagicales bacterium]